MTTIRQQAEQKAKALGVTIERESHGIHRQLSVEAPTHNVWTCRGVHVIVEAGFATGTWDFLYTAILEDMAAGLENCDEPNCEYCNPEHR